MESGGDAKNPFNNDYTSIITADAVYMAIAIVCVGLRLHVRKNLAGAIGLDDWLLIAGVVSSPHATMMRSILTCQCRSYTVYRCPVILGPTSCEQGLA